jgi:hypothetical protein
MAKPDELKGLSCPRCGGMVPIPEGQALVICPFCDLRSILKGERGVRRHAVPCRVDRAQAEEAMRSFLRGNWAIGGAVRREAQLNEVFLMHLPFWSFWGRAIGWAFGEKQVGSGDKQHYEPREERVVEEMSWNEAACEVGEFGVTQINLAGRPLEAFDADALHRSGMVFEPVGPASEAFGRGKVHFENRVRQKANLDRVGQVFSRIVRPRRALVYYPLWVMRYTYRGRSFQVVVDGFNGEVLYGKAPGNTLYRAAALVGGMLIGSLVAVNGPALILRASDSDGALEGSLVALAIGGVLMFGSYRIYRYGEHYEYRRYKGSSSGTPSFMPVSELAGQARRVLQDLERFK